MSNSDHFRRLENMYTSAPCNEHFTPQLTISEGEATLIIPVQEKFFHAAGAVHGSVYFKAMDDAAFFAANSLIEDVFVLTVTFTVHFLRPISAGEIRARGKVFQFSNRIISAESILHDSQGREIARGTGGFVRSNFPLSPDIGYD